ncbi:MBL fold metallo-hydrolase [Photobacterium sp. SDRW27]|uniref:MBL fold metallo-hydrolase n=1 Tax=Photobacterium obscurum TaxID=2829490 RepID=UPI002243368B|nr:MBL fold metallo-hydrolase [Photobacterium obscurum]MCW8330265.1 MBL fold metallo-hydrolase [Photobacterium obscurum]
MKLHQLEGYIQSIYLAEYEDKLLLLDGCSRADIPVIKAFIENTLQRPFNDLSLIVVTHMHPDHAGAAHKLRGLTGCKIATANVAGQWYSGLDGILMHFTDMLLAQWVANRMKKPRRNVWYSSKLKPDYRLDDGDALPGFPEWIALATQGHTDRDLSLHHIPSNRIYVADLMVTVKGRYIPPFPVFYPNRYRASLHKVMALEADSIILAHGGEVQPSEQEYQHLLKCAPNIPMTHWRSVKSKLKKVLTQ